MKLLLGDCLDKLKELDDNSVDSIVTDPPYGLSFMGKKWDYDVPSQQIWEECLRVLKPGGHILSFAGSRTYHRMAVRIEDAGFEIRDQIMWIYGSGFPKSHNIGHKLEEWQGWGTALKPAHEPIVMARKPLSEKTVAENVLEWGTGGINIDGCRVGTDETITNHSRSAESAISKGKYGDSSEQETHQTEGQLLGRFPANIILDEEAGKILDEQSGNRPGCKTPSDAVGSDSIFRPNQSGYQKQGPIYADNGGASRFFYCPKTSKSDRNEGSNNIHPTVKPTDLMLYLIRLVTKKSGTVLDPFMGSGSTGKAAIRGGFDFIGIEREKEYFEISKTRIEYEKNRPVSKPIKGNRVEVKPEVKEKINQFFE
jgi:site-specific DNA-methyltransferase (adenine-specific)